MKNLLSTSAFAIIVAFGGMAMAQEVIYEWTVEGQTFYGTLDQANAAENAAALDGDDFALIGSVNTTDGAPSLLERLLSDAAELQNSMTNIAENYANLDGGITITQDLDTLLSGIRTGTTTFTDDDEDGDPESTVVNGIDTVGLISKVSYTAGNATALEFFDPKGMMNSLGALSTTVIGSLGTGTVGTSTSSSSGSGATAASSNTLGKINLAMNEVKENSQAIAGTTQAYSTVMQENPSLISVANVAGNYANLLDGAINVTANDSLISATSMGTTVIGSLGTGNIAADLQRNLIGTSGTAATN